jgi:hypothetical protein
MKRLGISGLLLASLLANGQQFINTLYVNPSGDDANDGSLGNPFRSLARAFAQLTNDTRLVISGNYTNAVGELLLANCNNVELAGVEGASITFLGYGNGIRLLQFENFKITGLTFVGDRPATWQLSPNELGVNGALALAGTNNSGFEVRDCRFIDWPDQAITVWVSSGGTHGHTTDNVWIRNNVFENIGTTNFPAGAWTPWDGTCISSFFRNHVWVQNNYATNCLRFFEYEPAGDESVTNLSAGNWYVTDNVLVAHMGWVVFTHDYYGASSSNIWIERNHVQQSVMLEPAINLRASTNVFIRSNSFVSVSATIQPQGGSDNIIIEDNLFEAGYHSMICAEGLPVTSVPCWNLTIRGNTFRQVNYPLILGAVNTLVESNVFAGLPDTEPICISVLNGGHAYGPDLRGWATNLTFANNQLLPPFNPDWQYWLFTAGSNRLEQFTFAGNQDRCATPVTSMFLDPPWTYARSNMFIDQPSGSTGVLHGNVKATTGSRWVVDGVSFVNIGDANWEPVSTESIPPFIITQPDSQSQLPGSTVTFAVQAGGTPPLSYQWKFNNSDIPDATSPSLSLTDVNSAQAGTYRVQVSNSFGFVFSAEASLELAQSSQVTAWLSPNGSVSNNPAPPSELHNVVAVAAGSDFSLALNADSTVQSWGGSGSKGQSTMPPGLENVVAIAAAQETGLALRADGTVVAWGDNLFGKTEPPTNLTGAVAIAVGPHHCLALKSDGTVMAWGGTLAGEATVPGDLTNAVAIAAGNRFSLALKSDGTVIAWGDGLGLTPDLAGVTGIAAGDQHALAILDDGTVTAWGQNYSGQVGVVEGLSNVVAVSAAASHSLALCADGTVVEWDTNGYASTLGLTNVTAIAAGHNHNLAIIGAGPPTLKAPVQAAFAESGFEVALPSQSGRVYALEYQNALEAATWTALPLAAGNGGNLILTDSNSAAQSRFYRVRRW